MASQVVCGNEPLEVQIICKGLPCLSRLVDSSGRRKILPIEREPTNPEDKFTVAVQLEGCMVGHLPFNIAPTVL